MIAADLQQNRESMIADRPARGVSHDDRDREDGRVARRLTPLTIGRTGT
jgi:hypothetical protein